MFFRFKKLRFFFFFFIHPSDRIRPHKSSMSLRVKFQHFLRFSMIYFSSAESIILHCRVDILSENIFSDARVIQTLMKLSGLSLYELHGNMSLTCG